jgi:hypothetical protein
MTPFFPVILLSLLSPTLPAIRALGISFRQDNESFIRFPVSRLAIREPELE